MCPVAGFLSKGITMMHNRCVVIAAYNPFHIRDSIRLTDDDYIVCADGGYDLAAAEGIVPDVVIGDFDSMRKSPDAGQNVIRVAAEKDDTDTMLCVRHALERGFDEIVIVGGLGGRFDHTIANLQTLCFACQQVAKVRLIDAENELTVMTATERRFERPAGARYISLFSLSDSCTGVCITGVKYPLNRTVLKNNFPLGVSNEFVDEEALVRVDSGYLLVWCERTHLR